MNKTERTENQSKKKVKGAYSDLKRSFSKKGNENNSNQVSSSETENIQKKERRTLAAIVGDAKSKVSPTALKRTAIGLATAGVVAAGVYLATNDAVRNYVSNWFSNDTEQTAVVSDGDVYNPVVSDAPEVQEAKPFNVDPALVTSTTDENNSTLEETVTSTRRTSSTRNTSTTPSTQTRNDSRESTSRVIPSRDDLMRELEQAFNQSVSEEERGMDADELLDSISGQGEHTINYRFFDMENNLYEGVLETDVDGVRALVHYIQNTKELAGTSYEGSVPTEDTLAVFRTLQIEFMQDGFKQELTLLNPAQQSQDVSDNIGLYKNVTIITTRNTDTGSERREIVYEDNKGRGYTGTISLDGEESLEEEVMDLYDANVTRDTSAMADYRLSHTIDTANEEGSVLCVWGSIRNEENEGIAGIVSASEGAQISYKDNGTLTFGRQSSYVTTSNPSPRDRGRRTGDDGDDDDNNYSTTWDDDGVGDDKNNRTNSQRTRTSGRAPDIADENGMRDGDGGFDVSGFYNH